MFCLPYKHRFFLYTTAFFLLFFVLFGIDLLTLLILSDMVPPKSHSFEMTRLLLSSIVILSLPSSAHRIQSSISTSFCYMKHYFGSICRQPKGTVSFIYHRFSHIIIHLPRTKTSISIYRRSVNPYVVFGKESCRYLANPNRFLLPPLFRIGDF